MAKPPSTLLSRHSLTYDPVEISAQNLLGTYLVKDAIRLRITEVEAYDDQNDTASHARFGPTSRNEPMFGPAGMAYIYLCYGIHQMLNIVVRAEMKPAAILIRSVEVVAGLEIVLTRRPRQAPGPNLLAGPGKVGQALDLDRSWNNHDLLSGRELRLESRQAAPRVCAGPRIGIDFAEQNDRERCWRFADADSKSVKDRKLLRLLD